MRKQHIVPWVIGFIGILFLVPMGHAEMRTVAGSVQQALEYSPRLKVLKSNRSAVAFELQQARGGYLPQVDAVVGYGYEQHSDRNTRVGTTPGDEEWETRGEASLTLTQFLYDGGNVGGTVETQIAQLKSADNRVMDNAESVALDAVIAHLEVYRQLQLVTLAKKTVKAHQDILASLQERQRAGAGSRADVAQTQGRLARAKASLFEAQAEFDTAIANYERVVGVPPEDLASGETPEEAPADLTTALSLVQNRNPKVLTAEAEVLSAQAQEKVARSTFMPRLNLELSSSYEDQVEGDQSWQWTNSAMVRARWNLLNGGSDLAGRRAAASRTQQALSERKDQMVLVEEETKATWAQYQSSQERAKTFAEAVDFNEQTLDAYLKQFNVAQRSLLDVLDAENELFQSSGLLVTARVNQTVAAYRLLALAGGLRQALGL